MKQSKLTGVIKIKGGKKEIQSIMNNKYVYARLNDNKAVEPAVEESVDMKVVRVGMTDEEREEIIKGILERAAIKSAKMREEARREEKLKKDIEILNRVVKEAMREERKKYAPKTKLQAAMDMIGIDRRAVVRVLDELEKKFA